MHLNGENCENVIDRKTLWKWANGLNNIYDSQGQVCPHPGAIYMYITIIFKDLFPETAWPIKAKRLVKYS